MLGGGNAILEREHGVQSLAFLPLRNRFGKQAGGRVRAVRVHEGEHAVEFNLLHEVQGRLEIGLGLARETDDEIGGNGDLPTTIP